MPLQKGISESLPLSRAECEDQHSLKRKQSMSLDESKSDVMLSKDLSKNLLIQSNNLLIQSSTDTLLDMLRSYSGIKECSEETQIHLNMVMSLEDTVTFNSYINLNNLRVNRYQILVELYSRVKGAKCNRGAILGAIYGLVEVNSSKILLSVARVVLALNVSGSNLTGACKLVFKVARNEVNDSLFIDSDVPELLVDALGKVNPTTEG
jgi:armadillo repeat-containing protein 2